MKLQLTEDFCVEEIYSVKDNNPEYKKALRLFHEAVETGNTNKIDDAEVLLETTVSDIIYKKAFHDGMNFILKAISGKEVIEV